MDDASVTGYFPKTMWTLIARAGVRSEEGRCALASVVQRYLPALHAHLRYVHRIPPHEADDILQSFIADRFLENELASQADRNRGRFRNLLLVSLNHFVISHFRHVHAQRCDAGKAVSLQSLPRLTSDGPDPETMVQASWARSLIAQALKLMQDECNASGRQDVLGVFEARLVSVSLGEKPIPYLELAQRYKLSSPTHAANLLVTGKRMFARALRMVIAEYELDEQKIDQEIADLRSILSRA